MAGEKHIELPILGSGSTSFAAARRAQELGKTSAATEERNIGGAGVSRGCLPSKNLIEAGKLIHEAAMAMRFYARLKEFIDVIHLYSTMAEALR